MELTKQIILVSFLFTFLISACVTPKTQPSQIETSHTINSRAVVQTDSGMYQDIGKISNGQANFEICIDQEGKVIDVKIDKRNSTIADPDILENMKASLSKYRYEPSLNAEPQECGNYKLIVNSVRGLN